MYHALIWLLVIEVMGLIALPLVFNLFRRLPDRGLIFSKALALLLSSYLLWVLSLTHIVPNSLYTIIAILAVLAMVSALVLRRKMPEIVAFLRKEWVPLLTAELVFLGFFALWLSIVSSAPGINHTEKPMDFAFLNSILRSEYFPPEDPWLGGHSINYYYFGHFMMAFLTKLTAIPSSISYNLSLALIPALVAAGAFSLVYNLIRLSGARARVAVLFALGAPLFLVLIGNLEGVLELLHARNLDAPGFWQWASIKGLDGAQGGDPSVFPRDYLWWWRSTRIIDTVVDGNSLDYTITEFPFFSFLLGDLHAHVLALPFVTVTLALGLNFFVSAERMGLAWLRRNPWEAFAVALVLGSLAFINIWDFPVFVAVFVALVLVKAYGDVRGQDRYPLLPSLALLAPIVAGAVLLYLPFYLTLGSQASGILPTGEVMATRPLFFFLIWGPFLILGGSLLLWQLRRNSGPSTRDPHVAVILLIITLLPFLLWAGLALVGVPFDDGASVGARTVGARFGKLLPGLVIVGVALYITLLRIRDIDQQAVAFSLLLLALSLYLLVGAELFYVVDLFGNRMNTVFKLYYQAWLLLAMVSAYGLYYCWTHPFPSWIAPLERLRTPLGLPLGTLGKVVRYSWVAVVLVLLLASIYYPIGAALDRAKHGGDTTLDGLAFLRRGHSDEYEAIRWLRDEAPWGRIVEAVGDDYSEYGRISSSTGLPTVLGWKGHEHQWRGSTKRFHGREDQVTQIYTSSNAEEVQRLLENYGVRYIYVGTRERREYGDPEFENFSFLQPVFPRKGVVIEGVVIYEVLQEADRG